MAGDFTRWLANETVATLRHDLPRPPDPFAGIRAEALGSIAYADNHACPDIDNSCSAHHALRLLAAIEALSSALRTHRHTFTDHQGTEICGGCLRPECPDSPEAIITGALATKETADA